MYAITMDSNSISCENTVMESIALPCGLFLTSKKKRLGSILITALSSQAKGLRHMTV